MSWPGSENACGSSAQASHLVPDTMDSANQQPGEPKTTLSSEEKQQEALHQMFFATLSMDEQQQVMLQHIFSSTSISESSSKLCFSTYSLLL